MVVCPVSSLTDQGNGITNLLIYWSVPGVRDNAPAGHGLDKDSITSQWMLSPPGLVSVTFIAMDPNPLPHRPSFPPPFRAAVTPALHQPATCIGRLPNSEPGR